MDAGKRVVLVDRAFLILSVALGAFQAWIGRYSMGPDGMSYLDIGDAYLRGDWKAAINGYWGPLYSIVLGAVMRVFRPSMRWEFPLVHLVNFVVFLGALLCFRIFLRSAAPWIWDNSKAAAEDVAPLSAEIVLGLSYVLFLFSSLVLDNLVLVTPDLIVETLVLLLGALLLDLRAQHSWWKFGLFGALCGLGYLTKAVMFPLAFVFLAVLLFAGKISKARVGAVLLAGVVFLMVSSPFIFALSKAKGRLTYADTGKLNYAELVNPHCSTTHWQGEPAGSGTPLHATRKILNDPVVFEYAEPIGGTYPPWYDPSYWNDGMRPQFRLRAQVRVLIQSALAYGQILQSYSAFIAGMVIFLLMGKTAALRGIAQNWPILMVACAAAGGYGLVEVLNRFFGGFAALFFVGILTGIRLPKSEGLEVASRSIGLGVMLAMSLSLAMTIGDSAYRTLTVGAGPAMGDQIPVAEALQGMGLRANDNVAVFGDGVQNYWARLGKFKIIAEIDSPNLFGREFWALPADLKVRAYESLRRTQAKLIVAWDPPPSETSQGWKQIGTTQYYVYTFPK